MNDLQKHLARFAGERWEALRAGGATPQRPLWASTGTKDPAEYLCPGSILPFVQRQQLLSQRAEA